MHLATKVQLLPHDHRQLNLALEDGLLSLLSLELGLVVDVNAINFADFGDWIQLFAVGGWACWLIWQTVETGTCDQRIQIVVTLTVGKLIFDLLLLHEC